MSQPIQKNPVNWKEIFGWCCFDFANSSFTTIIITVIFPIYFTQVIFQAASNTTEAARALSYWAGTLSLSQIAVLIVSPLVGAFADRHACKKKLLFATAWICALATASLALPDSNQVLSILTMVFVANIAFSLGENLCAGFLPEISTPENAGRISGYGWSFGYIGGLVSLGLVGLLTISGTFPEWAAFPLTGLFFIVASAPTFIFLRERAVPHEKKNEPTVFERLKQTLTHLSAYRTLSLFLIAFMFLMSGLSVVFAFTSTFTNQVLSFSASETIFLFISLQISSALGAFIFGFMQDKIGSKKMLLFTLALWILISILVSCSESKVSFFLIANLAGLGIGSVQSACRAVVSTLTPPERAGEFFGFWGLFGKLGAVIGPLSIALGAAFEFNLRTSMLLNGLFFLISFCIILFLKLDPKRDIGSNLNPAHEK